MPGGAGASPKTAGKLPSTGTCCTRGSPVERNSSSVMAAAAKTGSSG